MSKLNYFVSVDKLRVCLNMPDNLYDYLKDHHTRYDGTTNNRILDEDNFTLVFIEEDEQKMTATLDVATLSVTTDWEHSFSVTARNTRVRHFSLSRMPLYTASICASTTASR